LQTNEGSTEGQVINMLFEYSGTLLIRSLIGKVCIQAKGPIMPELIPLSI